ncbi:hypothetical protein SORBI_3008G062601 [Sorghum bicolor]|uniref:Hydrophobic seed protein domain-containing protein n=1 Tax=Sorghum bicolor TaxID=4558 RepID=A0A1Z5R564_SORBI|nr:hypothetical protein SORBI_3008G062601 [Sorghum bicolor]
MHRLCRFLLCLCVICGSIHPGSRLPVCFGTCMQLVASDSTCASIYSSCVMLLLAFNLFSAAICMLVCWLDGKHLKLVT